MRNLMSHLCLSNLWPGCLKDLLNQFTGSLTNQLISTEVQGQLIKVIIAAKTSARHKNLTEEQSLRKASRETKRADLCLMKY